MAGRFRVAVALGLLLATHTQAQEQIAPRGAPSRPIELSEAFPWDEPVEQTFTVDSVLRWRRGSPAEAQQQTLIRAGRNHEPNHNASFPRRTPCGRDPLRSRQR
jgi:hypothetical protein